MSFIKRVLGLSVLMLAMALAIPCTTASASDFTKALTKDYFALSRVQYYYSSDPFAVKARAADQGKNVLPDDPAKAKKLPSKDRAELIAAHGRLMKALNGGFREQNPKQASKAQTSFDCWLDAVQKSHGKDWKCVKQCRDAFEKAIAQWKPPAPPPPKPKPKPMAKPAPPPPPPAPRSFIIFFDWNHSSIRPDAQRVLQTAVAYAKRQGKRQVKLTGYADRSGDAKYNLWLSKRRADKAKAAMAKLGFPAGGIATIGRGESAPLVPTSDGVREPRNRRVEINF